MTSAVPLADFPLLARTGRGGSRLVYLDSAATSQRPRAVLQAERDFLFHSYGPVGRGSHILAEEASTAVEDARDKVAGFVGVPSSELIWTKNATEAINIVSYGLLNAGLDGGELGLKEGDTIVVTRAEHHANLVPWQLLAARTGAKLAWLDVISEGPDAGRIDLDTLSVITERTKVVAITHVSNVTGAITPVEEIARAAKAVGALVVLDACQSVPHFGVDLDALGVDAAAFSAHKMLGPTGIGGLWMRGELAEKLPPVITGGSMVEIVTMENTTYAAPPAKFEPGTQPVSQIVGFGAACDYLQAVGMETIAAHEHALTERMIRGMADIDGVRILGPTTLENRVGAVAFDVADVHPHDVGQVLDASGVLVRVGHHCAQPIHRVFDTFSSSRASIGPYNTTDDVDAFLEALPRVRSYFGV